MWGWWTNLGQSLPLFLASSLFLGFFTFEPLLLGLLGKGDCSSQFVTWIKYKSFYLNFYKMLLYQDSTYYNKSTLVWSIVSSYSFGDPSLRPTGWRIENRLYIDGSRSVGGINCSLVIPINRQMQSDGDSDVYFDVELMLSKWRRHQIIKLSHKFLFNRITK